MKLFRLSAWLLLVAATPSRAQETAATIQARLDALKPGEAVSVTGTTTLDRPLTLWRDKASLVGSPKAALKTTGPFPAIVAGPPIRRYTGFARAHRVPFPGGDGTIATGLDVSDSRLTLRATAFERIPHGAARLTIAALIARKGPSWGNNDTAPILGTETDRLGYEPLRLVADPSRVMLDFKTGDGAEHRAWFRAPAAGSVALVGAVATSGAAPWADSGLLRLMLLLDLDAGRVAAVANGVVLTPMTDPALSPGSRLAVADWPNLTVGWDKNSGQGSYVLGGLRVCGRLMAPVDNPRLAGTDAALFGPSGNAADASLDLSVPMAGDDDPCVWYRCKGSKRGCGILVPAGWSPWDVTSEVEIRNLDITCGDPDYGQCIWSGPCLRLQVTDSTMRGGARGFDQHPQVVSYKSRLSGLGFYGQSEASLVIGKGIVHASDLHFDPSPRRAHIRWHSAGGVLEHVFVSEGKAPVILDIRAFAGQLAVRDSEFNREAEGPDCYIRAKREQIGPGQKAQLIIERVEVGSQPPKTAIVDLDDSTWRGRTDTIGSGLLTVRDSFTIVRPCAVARPGSAAWAVDVAGPLPAGVKATVDATSPMTYPP